MARIAAHAALLPGGATTVTGSQYLLDTGDARVVIDCGMFQGIGSLAH